jgi:hypothetical protein
MGHMLANAPIAVAVCKVICKLANPSVSWSVVTAVIEAVQLRL